MADTVKDGKNESEEKQPLLGNNNNNSERGYRSTYNPGMENGSGDTDNPEMEIGREQLGILNSNSIEAINNFLNSSDSNVAKLRTFLNLVKIWHSKDLAPPKKGEVARAVTSLILSLIQAAPYYFASGEGVNLLPDNPVVPNHDVDHFFRQHSQIFSLANNWFLGTMFFDNCVKAVIEAIEYTNAAKDKNASLELRKMIEFDPKLGRSTLSKMGHNVVAGIFSGATTIIFGGLTAEYSPSSNLELTIVLTGVNSAINFAMMFSGGQTMQEGFVWLKNKTVRMIYSENDKKWMQYYYAQDIVRVLQNTTVSRSEALKLFVNKQIALGNQGSPQMKKLFGLLHKHGTLGDTLNFLLTGLSFLEKPKSETKFQKGVRYSENALKTILCLYLSYAQTASLFGYYLLQKVSIKNLLLLFAAWAITSDVFKIFADPTTNAANDSALMWAISFFAFISFYVVSIKSSIKVGLEMYSTIRQFFIGLFSIMKTWFGGGHQTEPLFMFSPALKRTFVFLFLLVFVAFTSWYSAGTALALNDKYLPQELGVFWGNFFLNLLKNLWALGFMFAAADGTAVFNLVGYPTLFLGLAIVIIAFVYRNVPNHPAKNEIKMPQFIEGIANLLKTMATDDYLKLCIALKQMKNDLKVNDLNSFFGYKSPKDFMEEMGKKNLEFIGLDPKKYEKDKYTEDDLFEFMGDIQAKVAEINQKVTSTTDTAALPKTTSQSWTSWCCGWRNKVEKKPMQDNFTNATRTTRSGSTGSAGSSSGEEFDDMERRGSIIEASV